MSVRLICFVLSLAAPSVAQAAAVVINVKGTDGQPLAGAVVTVEPAKPVPVMSRGPYQMEQRNIAFAPHVLIVPVGASVAFPNRDKVRHHVYSFSKPKKFDLKLYGREEERSIVFDKPGVVALGCNIHDSMSGFIFVSPTPFAAQTDVAGSVSISGVPAGGAIVRVWHPSIRAAGNSLAQTVTVAPGGFATTFMIRR